MNKDELEKLKKVMMQNYWTEDLHHDLEELDFEDAKKIVESMSEDDIYQKVNLRQYQEDYIADYLEYLWEISESSYWRHIVVSLDIQHGLLWNDHMLHFEKLCSVEIPDYVLKAVLDFAINCENKQDLEAIGCVIKAQVERFGRLGEINNYLTQLNEPNQNAAKIRIDEMIKCKCKYRFY